MIKNDESYRKKSWPQEEVGGEGGGLEVEMTGI